MNPFKPTGRGLRSRMPAAVPKILLALGLLALAACAAPAPSSQAGGTQVAPVATPAAGTAPKPASTPAPATPAPATHTRQTGGPLPPERVGDRTAAVPAEVKVDASCRTDADCTVKNVGNCCGHYPACVNVNSPTDPKGVQQRCAKDGMAAVCGFPEIAGCSCVSGTCQAAGTGIEAVR